MGKLTAQGIVPATDFAVLAAEGTQGSFGGQDPILASRTQQHGQIGSFFAGDRLQAPIRNNRANRPNPVMTGHSLWEFDRDIAV